MTPMDHALFRLRSGLHGVCPDDRLSLREPTATKAGAAGTGCGPPVPNRHTGRILPILHVPPLQQPWAGRDPLRIWTDGREESRGFASEGESSEFMRTILAREAPSEKSRARNMSGLVTTSAQQRIHRQFTCILGVRGKAIQVCAQPTLHKNMC